jgi:hypothetical protein
MTTGIQSENEIALFAHQMIRESPSHFTVFLNSRNNTKTHISYFHSIAHHQNAVNMAKTLLISGKIPCADHTDDEDPLCIMNVIVREIINNQNLVSCSVYIPLSSHINAFHFSLSLLTQLSHPFTHDTQHTFCWRSKFNKCMASWRRWVCRQEIIA